MAQTGYTPLLIYASGTTGNTPSAANLTSSASGAELALNYFDGKLFYKDAAGVVQVLAGKGGTGVVAGSNTQIQFNNNGVFGAAAGLTWDGTYLTANSIKDSALTSGRIMFAGAAGLLSDAAGLTWDGTYLTANSIKDSALTSGRVTYAGASGLLQDSANLTFDGTTLTVNALTVSNATTLSGGTANGVAYLNGSKVLTTGSALTFDGTNLGNTGAIVGGGSSPFYASSGRGNVTSRGTSSAIFALGVNGIEAGYLFASSSLVTLGAPTGIPITFDINGEQMRLTSTGLGIGTSSPAYKLDVAGQGQFSAASTDAILKLTRTTSSAGSGWLGASSAYSLIVYSGDLSKSRQFTVAQNAPSDSLALDSSGNLGLGVTPSAWTNYKAFEIGALGNALLGISGSTVTTQNAYWQSGAWKYAANGYANRFEVGAGSGQFQWFTASNNTGGAGASLSFTQAMTLDASGNWGLGTTTTSPYRANLLRSDGKTLFATDGATADFAITCISGVSMVAAASTGVLALGTSGVERARIDSSGNLLVGRTGQINQERLGVTTSTDIACSTNRESTTAYYPWIFYSNSTTVGYIYSTSTTTTYATSSDYRLKENIQPMTGALAKVAALKPCTYKWKADGSDGEGFIAHELAEVVPQCVTGEKDAVDADGNPVYQGIDTSFLVATLTAAIQELKAEFDAYKASHP